MPVMVDVVSPGSCGPPDISTPRVRRYRDRNWTVPYEKKGIEEVWRGGFAFEARICIETGVVIIIRVVFGVGIV